MPKCNKCGKEFPNRALIEGKVRVLNKRKYCLECSPFDRHNTAKLEVEEAVRKQRRHKQISDAVMRRREKIKRMAVEYKGGKCSICGYDRYTGALEFHHLDPAEKSFGISKTGVTRSWEATKRELDKCILLCANCHREVEAGLIKL